MNRSIGTFAVKLLHVDTITMHFCSMSNERRLEHFVIVANLSPQATDKKVSQLLVWVLAHNFYLLIGKISVQVSLTKRFFSFGSSS